jgi:hypothetical protein
MASKSAVLIGLPVISKTGSRAILNSVSTKITFSYKVKIGNKREWMTQSEVIELTGTKKLSKGKYKVRARWSRDASLKIINIRKEHRDIKVRLEYPQHDGLVGSWISLEDIEKAELKVNSRRTKFKGVVLTPEVATLLTRLAEDEYKEEREND